MRHDDSHPIAIPSPANDETSECNDDLNSVSVALQHIHRAQSLLDCLKSDHYSHGREHDTLSSPLSEYHLRMTTHDTCPTTHRKFVPYGEANATECFRTRLGGFPHIIERVPEEEGGYARWHVITGNNVLLSVGVHRVVSRTSSVRVSEDLLMERANRLLESTLKSNAEFPLTEIRMRMRLVAAHIPHTSWDADPVGVGDDKWWDRTLSTEVDGQRHLTQLLHPAETSGDYNKALVKGNVSYAFKIRQGVTSFSCRLHKQCEFKFVVEPDSETLRAWCPQLTILSEPFWVSSKYHNGRRPKVTMWLESEVEGGEPVAYDARRKRPRMQQT